MQWCFGGTVSGDDTQSFYWIVKIVAEFVWARARYVSRSRSIFWVQRQSQVHWTLSRQIMDTQFSISGAVMMQQQPIEAHQLNKSKGVRQEHSCVLCFTDQRTQCIWTLFREDASWNDGRWGVSQLVHKFCIQNLESLCLSLQRQWRNMLGEGIGHKHDNQCSPYLHQRSQHLTRSLARTFDMFEKS